MELTQSDKLVELLFTPMTDVKMIELFDSWGLEQPKLDEQYEMDLDIFLVDINNSGVSLTFEELDEIDANGDPVLNIISFEKNADGILNLPFGIKENDSYQQCCDTLQSKADYLSKYVEEVKIWLREDSQGRKFTVSISFKDESFSEVDAVIIAALEADELEDELIENKE